MRPHVVHYEGGDLVAGVIDGTEVSTSPDQVPDLGQFVGQDIVVSDVERNGMDDSKVNSLAKELEGLSAR